MSQIDDIKEKIEELEKATFVLENIVEASEVGRFKFTEKEVNALVFSIDVMNANLASFKEEL